MKDNGSVIVSAFDSDDNIIKYLLMKSDWTKDDMWELPGRGTRDGESTLNAALGSLREELSLAPDMAHPKILSLTQKKGSLFEVYLSRHVFLPEITPNTKMVSDWNFFSLAEILMMRGMMSKGTKDKIRFAAFTSILRLEGAKDCTDLGSNPGYLSNGIHFNNYLYEPYKVLFR